FSRTKANTSLGTGLNPPALHIAAASASVGYGSMAQSEPVAGDLPVERPLCVSDHVELSVGAATDVNRGRSMNLVDSLNGKAITDGSANRNGNVNGNGNGNEVINVAVFRDIRRFPHARCFPGVLILRFGARLAFFNAAWFRRTIERFEDRLTRTRNKIMRVYN